MSHRRTAFITNPLADTCFVAAAAVAMICVQLLDAVIDARIPDRLKTIGPAATGVVNAAVLVWLLTS